MTGRNLAFGVQNISTETVHLHFSESLAIEPGATVDLLTIPGVTLNTLSVHVFLLRQLASGKRLIRATIANKTNPTNEALDPQTLVVTRVDLETAFGSTLSDVPASPLGVASAGTSPLGARVDHVHILPPNASDSIQVVFSQTTPFDANYLMPQTRIEGALSFVPDYTKTKLFGTCYIRLIANGTNTPAFTGFIEHGSSTGFINTLNIINNLLSWYDGLTFWYSWSQAANASPVLFPVIVDAWTAANNPSLITLTYSTNLDTTSIPSITAFALANSSGADVVTVVSVTGKTVVLSKSKATIGTETVALNYAVPASGFIRGNDINLVNATALTSFPVDTDLSPVFVRMTSLVGSLVESGNASIGYTYTSSGSLANTYSGVPSKYLPANTNGLIMADTGSAGNKLNVLGLDDSSVAQPHTTMQYAIYSGDGSSFYKQVTNGAGSGSCNIISTHPFAVGDIVRLRRVGTIIYAEVSKNSGSTFTAIHSWTGSTALLYPLAAFDVGGAFVALRCKGMI